jgi:hypothetical protein
MGVIVAYSYTYAIIRKNDTLREIKMTTEEENYTFPWGFNLGSLNENGSKMPLLTPTEDGGFCLLYDDVSEKRADKLLESLALQLLDTMPTEHLLVDMFDHGRKKFYQLSALQNYIHLYTVSYNQEMIEEHFQRLEEKIIARHQELLCCNRQTINEHNQKSRQKQNYHLVLINLANFPHEEIELRRIKNFVESASLAGVYVIAFGNQEIKKSENKGIQTILKQFKNLNVTNNEFEITPEIFEFTELLQTHTFEPLDLDRQMLHESIMNKANLEQRFIPEILEDETHFKN